MGLPNTLRKLREARFFLSRLQTESRRAGVRPEPEAFGFYLSAFLSAARSVTWVLQKENKPLYDREKPTWWDALTPDEQDLCDFFKEERNAEVKQTGARVSSQPRPVRAVLVPGFEVFGEWLSHEPAIVSVPEWYFTREANLLPVVETCERYLEVLARFVMAVDAKARDEGPLAK